MLPAPHLIGSMLADQRPRPCGLCNDMRQLSKAHVPPQAAGNTTRVMRLIGDLGGQAVQRPRSSVVDSCLRF